MNQTPLLLIGCGNMGSALLARWHASHSYHPIFVVDPHAKASLADVEYVKTLSELPDDFAPAMIVIAVKPQQLDDVLPALAEKFKTYSAYLSIAAGKNIAYYEKHLGQGVAIVRAMPNTPAMIGEGITALVGNARLTPDARTLADNLLGAVGETLWLDDESRMDAVTALSGSGPAYIYYILECMVAAGVKNGLSEADARQLAAKTCEGAAALALESTHSLEDLRKAVTSPGGTTEAGLGVLQKDHILHDLIEHTVAAAIARAKAL